MLCTTRSLQTVTGNIHNCLRSVGGILAVPLPRTYPRSLCDAGGTAVPRPQGRGP